MSGTQEQRHCFSVKQGMEFAFPRMKIFTAGWIQRPQKEGKKEMKAAKPAKVTANGGSTHQMRVNHPLWVRAENRGINAQLLF